MTPKKDKPKLLLVDDEEGIRRVLAITLADLGYHVLLACSGEEALELFERHQPCIILADIKMPGLDGIELLKAIKNRSAQAEVIMITGHGDMEAAIRSLKLEATDFITKPIHEGALEIALKRARERITMRAQLAQYTERLEAMVAQKTHQLIEAERMAAIGQTIAGLSHTIKNIAGGLKGGAYGIERGMELNAPQYWRQGWQIVKGNVEKITRLSLDMVNFAKSAQHNAQWHDPNRPLEEVAAFLRPQAESNRIELTIEFCPDPGMVWLDPETIYQALLNLGINAMEAFAGVDDARQRKVALKTTQPADWAVAYQVSDNGCGMDPETEKRLGRCFFTTKGSGGTGIGVMMTQAIVDKHRGELRFTTRAGHGTEVMIWLPRVGEQNTAV